MTRRLADWSRRLGEIDRRWIYLVLALSIVVAMTLDLRFPDRLSRLGQPIYDRLESLPPGTPILLSLEISPNNAPELEPMAFALCRHALLRGHRIVLMSLWPTGSAHITRVIEQVVAPEFPDAVEGRDFVNLGYKTGSEMLINSMRLDLSAMYTTDAGGRALSDLPVMAGISSLADFGLIIGLTGGTPGLKEWILFGGDPTGVPVAGGSTGVGMSEFLAYYPRQVIGLLGGLKGAAEYESALSAGYPDFEFGSTPATDYMGPQVVAHVVIILFILLGNLGIILGWIQRRRDS